MSFFDLLAWEHRLFRKLIERLETFLKDGEKDPGALESTLAVLFSALSKHEQIEETLFDRDVLGPGQAASYWTLCRHQHRAIDRLRGEFENVFKAKGRIPFEEVEILIHRLVLTLRGHFETEESRLWPAYYQSSSRSLASSAERRAWKIVHQLEHDMRGDYGKNVAIQ